MALRVSGLSVAYRDVQVLDVLSFAVDAGEVVAVMGPSGTGKSTLLSVISGLLVPDAGQVWVGEREVTGLSLARRADVRRRHIGQVFQDAALIPELDVAENVALTLIFDGVPRRKALDRARQVLDGLGVGEHASKSIDQVSGGQAQRVALARALVRQDVDVLLADEPTASLDVDNAQRVARLLVDTSRERGVATLLATHDPAVAALCDRVLDLRHQHIAA